MYLIKKMLKLLFTMILLSLASVGTVKATFNTEIEVVHEEPDPSPEIEPKIKPFEVVTSEKLPEEQSSLTIYQLPSSLKEENGNWRLASELRYTVVIPLCPEFKAKDSESLEILQAIRETFPNTAKCLFIRKFEKNEIQECDEEPQFVIEKIMAEDGSHVICGINDDQQLVEVQYHNCGSETYLQDYDTRIFEKFNEGVQDVLPFEPHRYTMYQICYDFQTYETVWTKHKPMTPELLLNEKSPYKKLSNEFLIEDFDDDTSSLDLPDATFSKLKTAYKNTNDNATTVFTMVPKDHMALPYWKKATTHMINSAPLQTVFIPLMKAINNGILQASKNLFSKTRRTLQIYTKAETIISPILSLVANVQKWLPVISYVMPRTPLDLFESNIWRLLVYDETDKSGVMILLHNFSEELSQSQSWCKDNELLRCDFKTWSDSPEYIVDDILKNAYCCKINAEEAKVFFSLREIELNETLHIQNLISGENIEPLETNDKKNN